MSRALKLLTVVVFLITTMLSGCNNNPQEVKYETQLYFVNAEGTKLVSETRELQIDSETNKVGVVLEELLKGPIIPENKKCIPDGTTIKKITTEGSLAVVDFSSNFNNTSETDGIFARTSVVSTLTSIPGVDRVLIKVDGVELRTKNGDKVGIMSKRDIVYDTEPQTEDKQYVKLYFADKEAVSLVAEAREITVTQKETPEMKVLKELIKGPTNKQLIRTIPQETKILSVETKEGVCFVNLSQEFKAKNTGGSAGETLTIYSIVNSLTELENIQKVQFLIEGQKTESFIHMVFNEPFTRDETLIEK